MVRDVDSIFNSNQFFWDIAYYDVNLNRIVKLNFDKKLKKKIR